MDKKRHAERLRRAEQSVADAREGMDGARYRQRYHFMPEAFWMNDPNGFIHFRGQYHLFYQFHPYSPEWGSMHWGHAVSEDLLHWKHLPIALAPSEPYDDHPTGGIFSGSAVEHNGELYVFYTGTTRLGERALQTQCLAISTDGIAFDKHPDNPVVREFPPVGSCDIRDPKVWCHDGKWYMVLGTCKDGCGKAVLYQSDDLFHWEFAGTLAESQGDLGSMWECPDVFEIGGRDVLVVSPVHAGLRKAVYLVGDLDYGSARLDYGTMGEVDCGFDAYAPQSMLDIHGRRIMIAWANSWDWMPWFKDYGPTMKENWCGAMTLPRVVDLDPNDGRLTFKPIDELTSLRDEPTIYENGILGPDGRMAIKAGDGVSCEILVDLDQEESDCMAMHLFLRVGHDHSTKVALDFMHSEISLDRSRSDQWTSGVCTRALRTTGRRLVRLHIFLDTSSIEVYADDYKTVMSCNIYPDAACDGIYMESVGGFLHYTKIETYGIRSVW